jgi:Ca2+-binding EF-hand superfamily protein
MIDLDLHKESDIDLAKLVFNEIDSDSSGYIEVSELHALLKCWGLPNVDIVNIFEKDDMNHDGKIDLNEFLINMKPIWTFGCKVIKSNQDHQSIFEARSVR